MTETIKAWQCIGCGRLDAPAPCVGVCRDRPVELVDVAAYASALARVEALERVVRRLTATYPRERHYEEAWRALQSDARKVLAAARDTTPPGNADLANEPGLGNNPGERTADDSTRP